MFGIDFLDITVLVVITVAVVNAIKKAVGDKIKGQWYMLISAGVGAAIYAIGLYAPDVVKGFIAVGLVASGLYDIYKKK